MNVLKRKKEGKNLLDFRKLDLIFLSPFCMHLDHILRYAINVFKEKRKRKNIFFSKCSIFLFEACSFFFFLTNKQNEVEVQVIFSLAKLKEFILEAENFSQKLILLLEYFKYTII